MQPIDKEYLERLYVAETKSIPDIAKITGLTISTARNRLIDFGIPLRSRADGIKAVSHKLGVHLIGKRRPHSEDTKRKMSLGHQQSSRVKSAAGVSLRPNGYLEYTTGEHKGRSVHVVEMEKIIGRRITENEVVHHKDENKTNNDPDNLELMTRAEHARHHGIENYVKRTRSENGQFE
jgi:hypothetical protein